MSEIRAAGAAPVDVSGGADRRDLRRTQFVLFTMVVMVVLNVVAVHVVRATEPDVQTWLGWRLATANTASTLALLAGWWAWMRDGVLGRWLAFGLAAGVVELPVDAWLVERAGRSLVYPPGGVEPLIWDSPVYMPFAWAIILVQIGVISAWLRRRLGVVAGAVVTALVAGVNIPFYEHLAHDAHYWSYERTPMLLGAPYYVIVSEFLLALPLAPLGLLVERRHGAWSLALGALEGAWMFPCVWIAWRLVGPCAGALIQFACR